MRDLRSDAASPVWRGVLHSFSHALHTVLLACVVSTAAAPLPRLKVCDNHRFLCTADGKPFFYLADTAWELFHRLDRKQALEYLDTRAAQGFTAIQAVALAELDGVTDPNAYGKLPLIDKDPTRRRPSPESYWEHVDYIVDQANARGLYIAMLPSWGRWVNNTGRTDESLLTPANAQHYGEFLGKRYGRNGVIWILGGDRTATGFEATWRALARGIAIGVSGKEDYDAVLMSFHPRGGETSSTWFHADPWLDFNMHQTGHGLAETSRAGTESRRITTARPSSRCSMASRSTRIIRWRSARATSATPSTRTSASARIGTSSPAPPATPTATTPSGRCTRPARKPVNGPLFYWNEAIHRPGATQMQYVRALVESRPYLSRVPDQSLVANALEGADHIAATRGDGYAFIYSAQGRKFTVHMEKLGAAKGEGLVVQPAQRQQHATPARSTPPAAHEFACPSEGFGSDWVLVLDDAARDFPAPGVTSRTSATRPSPTGRTPKQNAPAR